MRHLIPRHLAVVSIVSVLTTVAATDSRAIVINDGMVHTIDAANSFPFEPMIVDAGPGGAATTIQLVPGGEIGTVTMALPLTPHKLRSRAYHLCRS